MSDLSLPQALYRNTEPLTRFMSFNGKKRKQSIVLQMYMNFKIKIRKFLDLTC